VGKVPTVQYKPSAVFPLLLCNVLARFPQPNFTWINWYPFTGFKTKRQDALFGKKEAFFISLPSLVEKRKCIYEKLVENPLRPGTEDVLCTLET
jgi:hypothetical protein